ncbi:MAG TPA: PstS family phosphate ABC transporter substrate-binding protein [Bellilinea sp.]|nr:PstS family phosphate ABC transporter substrate-binding protein [Bellilinea sp.]
MKFAARIIALVTLLTLLTACAPTSNGSTEPPASTYIQNKGSDTIVNLALAWAEAYQSVLPEVRISVTGGGSGTGLTALLSGTVDIANASRKIKDEEIEAAQANGIEPVEHVIARDAIAVIVNPENPIDQLSLEDIARIYRGEVSNWSELGGEDRPIVKLSRETNSGTHVYFLEEVVRLGDPENTEIFSADTLLLPSSEGIISEVADNPNAIGYDGLGYVTAEVKMLAVTASPDQPYVLPSVETVNNGQYPISRDLYMYTRADAPQTVLDYLAWIVSPEAQKIVTRLGFVPILVKTAGK